MRIFRESLCARGSAVLSLQHASQLEEIDTGHAMYEKTPTSSPLTVREDSDTCVTQSQSHLRRTPEAQWKDMDIFLRIRECAAREHANR